MLDLAYMLQGFWLFVQIDGFSPPELKLMQGADMDAAQMLSARAAGSTGRSLRQGTSFRSSFRSRPLTAQTGDDDDSQQGVEDEDVCRVDCWNGGYLEAKGQAEKLREQQDWLTHNKEVLHGLQVGCLLQLWSSN